MKRMLLTATLMAIAATAAADGKGFQAWDVTSKGNTRIVIMKNEDDKKIPYQVANFNCDTHSVLLGAAGKDPDKLPREITLSDTYPVTRLSPYYEAMQQACP